MQRSKRRASPAGASPELTTGALVASVLLNLAQHSSSKAEIAALGDMVAGWQRAYQRLLQDTSLMQQQINFLRTTNATLEKELLQRNDRLLQLQSQVQSRQTQRDRLEKEIKSPKEPTK